MIQLDNLCVRAGVFRLKAVSLNIPSGGYGVLMGPTGCGKTSLLEAVCGLRQVTGGRILIGGQDVTAQIPATRGIGYVPQDAALFPQMSIAKQIGLGLKLRGQGRQVIKRRVDELADVLAIRHLLHRRPAGASGLHAGGLSGGERQRVALARALAYRPRVLCLDEPISALDEPTRDQIIRLIRALQEAEGFTALHVTHASQEARMLATHLFRFDRGQVVASAASSLPAEREQTPADPSEAQQIPFDAADPDRSRTLRLAD